MSSNFYRVVHEGGFLLLLNLSLLLFDLLLLLDLDHVVLSLDSSLLSQGLLFLGELNLSGHLEIGCDSLSLLVLKSFSFSSLSFSLFEGSLGSKSINFGLSVGSFLLEFSKSLDFSLLLVLDSLGLELCFVLLLVLGFLVRNDCIFFVLCFLRSLVLLDE